MGFRSSEGTAGTRRNNDPSRESLFPFNLAPLLLNCAVLHIDSHES